MQNQTFKNGQKKALIRLALITSPIIGVYTITPMILFVTSVKDVQLENFYINEFNVIKALVGISFFVFIEWMLNIWLFSYADNQLGREINKKYKYIFSYAFMFVAVLFSQIRRMEMNPIDFKMFSYYPFVAATANNTFILILYRLITGRHEKAQLELDKTKLELAQYVTQQEQLKNKIHPHFIFNALNTLKLLIKREQGAAEDYLVRLSSYLRFSITETAKDISLIKDELEFCQNYIELQKVRFANSITFHNLLPQEVINNEYLPVVTLQSLAENAIKHNAFTKRNPLVLELRLKEDGNIAFSNNVIPKRTNEETTGTGLDNLRRRFELLGNDSLSIVHHQEDKQFEVTFNTIKK
ncbi:histidine kinase [Flammeovirga yaeyamensis]|uniref:Histidine kinase n=1 Tax=Flammeovirga yaeyamensis TaxID=367791 RepID=A0AAX1ND81_9BACT|nr:histidine kinase [Flammeovirga yaeyamensis]MBB3696536.1 sensor histidine kinase YesM [Flammeovirga yaeyamensis]NMF33216.1 histidine kinase [Flammeovirga yaeyamensis]QWG05504.1 histidine kinase [Flammeovirga yaeyamensis]